MVLLDLLVEVYKSLAKGSHLNEGGGSGTDVTRI